MATSTHEQRAAYNKKHGPGAWAKKMAAQKTKPATASPAPKSTHEERAEYNKINGPGAWAKKMGKTPASSGGGVASGTQDPQAAALEALYGKSGVDAGNALIEKFGLGGQFLGRMNTAPSAGQQEALAKMKAGLGGYTSPEYQAMREQQMRGLNSNLATSSSQLAKAQARGKVYGAAAGAQQSNLITANNRAKDELEQDLMIKNIDEQRSRLKDVAGAEESLYKQGAEAEKVNLGQEAAETSSRINAFTGAGGQAMLSAQQAAAERLMKEALKKLGR